MQSDAEPVPAAEDGDGVPGSRVDNRELNPEGEDDLITGDHRDPADAVPTDREGEVMIQEGLSPQTSSDTPGSGVTKKGDKVEDSLAGKIA